MAKVSQLRDPRTGDERFDHRGLRYCDGRTTTGHWRGYRCNAVAKHTLGELHFCGAHFALATAESSGEKGNG